MAIYNSIALGSASGKLGNLVLYKLKGQNVAREWIVPPNPQSPNQQINRNRMRNCVHAFQWLKYFLRYSKALEIGTLTYYNSFVKIIKESLPNAYVFGGASAAALLCPQVTNSGNFTKCTRIVFNGDFTVVHFEDNGREFEDNLFVILCSWNSDNEEYVEFIEPVSLEYWNMKEIQFPDISNSLEFASAYMFSSDQTKISNFVFTQGND